MDRNRPLIGICGTSARRLLALARRDQRDDPLRYTRSVHDAGGLPLVLPPFVDNTELLDLPTAWSSAKSRHRPRRVRRRAAWNDAVWPHRDRAEIAMMRAARPAGAGARDLPRMQLLTSSAEARSGSISPTCSMASPTGRRRRSPGTPSRSNPARGSGRSWSRRPVRTQPHQAPERIGDG
jgi:hypothetical protein